MKLVIFINDCFEDERALVDIENKRVLLSGDIYHDRISSKIEGYVEALRDADIYHDEIEEEFIDEEHELFSVCHFYC